MSDHGRITDTIRAYNVCQSAVSNYVLYNYKVSWQSLCILNEYIHVSTVELK